MDLIMGVAQFILHLDVHLKALCAQYGDWIYGLIFLVVFCETGLVATPFLPGDSLLFASGALAATGALDAQLLVLGLIAAAFLGDNTNYWIGRMFGMRLFAKQNSRIFHRDYLLRTQDFFSRHGGKAIVIGRFIPIIRTYIPFAAGTTAMRYGRFIGLSLIGSVCWVSLFVYGGRMFGNLPLIADHFTYLTLGVIGVSLIPITIEIVRGRTRKLMARDA